MNKYVIYGYIKVFDWKKDQQLEGEYCFLIIM